QGDPGTRWSGRRGSELLGPRMARRAGLRDWMGSGARVPGTRDRIGGSVAGGRDSASDEETPRHPRVSKRRQRPVQRHLPEARFRAVGGDAVRVPKRALDAVQRLEPLAALIHLAET